MTVCTTDIGYVYLRIQALEEGFYLKDTIVCLQDILVMYPGYVRTLNAIRKGYFWPGMKRDVLNYVKGCLSCQRIKAERVKMPGKLEPLDTPEMKWECISMDFVTRLPSAQGGYDSIMVVVDLLTKVSHLIPVKTSYTASDIARLFVKEIYRIHGLPKRIISDRDAKFTSKFWTSLFQAIGTQL